jgi:hypothetical protein
MQLKMAGRVDSFVAKKLHLVPLFAFIRFQVKARQTFCVALSDSLRSAQSLACAHCLQVVFIGALAPSSRCLRH